MQTAADLIAGALRLTVSDIDEVIFKIRRRHFDGKDAPKASARYAAYLRHAHELREKGLAVGATGPLFDIMQPTAYRDQLVGYSPAERKALEWKGVFSRFPFPAVVPFHYSIAAE